MKHDEVGCYFQILELKKIGLNLITGTHMLLIQANPPWLGARLAQRIKKLSIWTNDGTDINRNLLS